MAPRVIPALSAWLKPVVERLAAGHLVALPTETVYGLAADAENRAAVRAVFAAKGRPADHPLIVHVADSAMARRYAASWPAAAEVLAERFWPGPLTIVLPAGSVLPEVTGGQPTVALRVPAHPFTQAVIAALGRAVVAPSANRFGRVSPTCAEHVVAEFPDSDLWVVDGGPAPVGVESTIVDLSSGQRVSGMVLRPGAIGSEALVAALNNTLPKGKEGSAISVTPRVSGTLPTHYAPRTPLRLWQRPAYERSLATWKEHPESVPLHAVWFPEDWPAAPHECLRLVQPNDPRALARSLYAALRALDYSGATELWVALPQGEEALLVAVRDRLSRAAHSE